MKRLARPLGLCAALCVLLTGCGALGRIASIGRPPELSPTSNPTEAPTWRPITMPMPGPEVEVTEAYTLWRAGSRAFFKDQRAARVGDIITILVNVNDQANLKNQTATSRTATESGGMAEFFGLETLLPKTIADPSKLLSVNSAHTVAGSGQIQRNDVMVIRLAGVVTQTLPNGNLVVAARQEFRVNAEMRELHVTGVIRPQDIASDNTVQHDRMAEARIMYGGRGQLTDMQTGRWGQQLADILLPF